MTFNLKSDTPLTRKKMQWKNRKDIVIQLIQTYHPDILGVQELTLMMKEELKQVLPEYGFIGQGRNKRLTLMNEETNILYLTESLECLQESTFWLSTKPNVKGSRIWTSIFPRICTKALFLDKKNGDKFFVYNTHLDHLVSHSRNQELWILTQSIQHDAPLQIPVLLMGDFNTTSESKALQNFLSINHDLRSVYTSLTSPLQNTIHHGWGRNNLKAKPIDYIFVSKSCQINSCDILTGQFNGIYPSDHYPVLCDINLNQGE